MRPGMSHEGHHRLVSAETAATTTTMMARLLMVTMEALRLRLPNVAEELPPSPRARPPLRKRQRPKQKQKGQPSRRLQRNEPRRALLQIPTFSPMVDGASALVGQLRRWLPAENSSCADVGNALSPVLLSKRPRIRAWNSGLAQNRWEMRADADSSSVPSAESSAIMVCAD